MAKHFTTPITYFLKEGKDNLEDCLKIVFEAAKKQAIRKVVIFTARGEGVKRAIDQFLALPEYEHIKLVAVTFPAGEPFTDEDGDPISVEIPDDLCELFRTRDIPIIKSHLPFDPISTRYRGRGVLGQDLTLVGDALSIFGGSMGLCIQAAVLACDAGAIDINEHIIVMTSDTALLLRATTTRRMLGELIVREVLCKPAIMDITRKEVALHQPKAMPATETPQISAKSEDSEN